MGHFILNALALNPRIWWPLFPLLLLIVIIALSTALVWTIRKKCRGSDVAMQALALGCYVFTAIVAIASEGGGAVSANLHRIPSVLTQIVLLAQIARLWNRRDAKLLRAANIIALVAILADTALHYVMAKR
jgi:hypothetical protein